MALPRELITAYEKAQYCVDGMPELTLRVGELNPSLDALLEENDASSAAYLTAANPGGKRLSAEENESLMDALHEYLAAAGHEFFEGHGVDPAGAWPAEPSLLVIGIPRADAFKVGLAFEQNALVFIEKGGAAELVLLA